MAERQLHLFEPARPLLERFGNAFFRAVPPRPGIYIMGGEQDRVLYIGQSRNLRTRLGSYKNARPDRAPRKVIRLVHAVRSIVWEECPTAAAARLRENSLLRTHRPRFNRMNTWPRAYRFITMRCEGDRLSLALSSEPNCDGKIFGAFKGTGAMWGSLLRLLWTAWHQATTHEVLPASIGGLNPPTKFNYCSDKNASRIAQREWEKLIEDFFTGTSDELVSRFDEDLRAMDSTPMFAANLRKADLDALTAFYLRGPHRMKQVREQHGAEHPVIPQEEVDDWLVLAESKNNAILPECK